MKNENEEKSIKTTKAVVAGGIVMVLGFMMLFDVNADHIGQSYIILERVLGVVALFAGAGIIIKGGGLMEDEE